MKLPFTNDFFAFCFKLTADSSTDRGNPDGGVPSLRKGQMTITNQNPLMVSKYNQKHKSILCLPATPSETISEFSHLHAKMNSMNLINKVYIIMFMRNLNRIFYFLSQDSSIGQGIPRESPVIRLA